MSDERDPAAAVSALRAAIDAVDHALVNLLAERRVLVGELLAYKQRHRLPLIDPAREEHLVVERAGFAEARGVPAALAAAVFHAVLECSHSDAENLARMDGGG